jgi:UDP-glucose 4-epimerase
LPRVGFDRYSIAMNVLVVGGAGYIGSHCVRQVMAAGHLVVVLDNLSYGHRESVPNGVPFIKANMGDGDSMRATLRDHKIDLVMHFAAFASVGESVQQPERYYENNVVQTQSLLEAMLAEGVKKLVFSSTCATYGVPEKMPMTENLPQKPINPYGQNKLDVENILKKLAAEGKISFAAFRYFNAAGASVDGSIGEDHEPENHLIPLAIAAALGRRPPLKVFGNDYPTPDGTCLRDYVHVDDLSSAHIAVFDKLGQPGLAFFYNLGMGVPYSVEDILKSVERVTGKPVPREYVDRRVGDPPALYADATKARNELGWKPMYDTLDAIVSTAVRWHTLHPKGFSKN